MSLFKPAQNNAAYLKAAFMGLAGSGKTFTASSLAIGMVQYMQKHGLEQGRKPVYFVDSENGASWMIKRFEEVGIDLQVASTTTFTDLAQAMNIARSEASVLIIDSITAFWVEFTETYKEVKKRRRGLEFQDWSWLKNEWRKKFTTRFLNDPIHTIMCGRMGFEYEHYVDDTGKKQIEKTGVKLKAEGELGFEPSLLVQMERQQDVDEHTIHHIAHVLKDRRPDAKSLDGKSFKDPTFASFLPHVEYLNIGGKQFAFDDNASSAASIPDDERGTNNTTSVRREIVIDEIEALLVEKGLSGTSNDAKAKRAELIKKHFKCTSRTEIEKLMPLHDLQANYDSLHRDLTGEPSRYGVRVAEAPPTADEVPTFDTPANAPQTSSESTSGETSAPVAETGDAMLDALASALEAASSPAKVNSVWKGFEKVAGDVDDERMTKAKRLRAEAWGRVTAKQPVAAE